LVDGFKGGGGVRDPVVRLERVTTYYVSQSRPAIRDVNLEIPRGGVTLITGPNGAGKTTLLETILGLLRPRSGRVYVFGHDMRRDPWRVRRLCGYLPQDFMKSSLEPFLVRDVVAMGLSPLRPMGALTGRDWELVSRALRTLGIEGLAGRPYGRLSGGQQQKVMLARALVREPKLLLLDEPFSALDRESRKFLAYTLIPGLVKSGVTVVMVSHDTTVIPEGTSMVVLMEDGEVVEVRG